MAKPKLNAEMSKRICDNIKIGMSYKGAALSAGIVESTFYEWLAKGNKAKSGMYKEFSESVSKANGEARKALVARVHLNKDWRSDAWILERRFPDEWNKKDNVDLSIGGDINVIIKDE
jgi:transposase